MIARNIYLKLIIMEDNFILCYKISEVHMEFFEHLKKYLSDDDITNLKFSLKEKAKKAIIINTNKIDEKFILESFPNLIKHPIVNNCYLYNDEEYQLGKHIFFEQGLYYIFEPCSALINYFLNPLENDIVLDLCAAPGGKTSHLAILKKNQGIIISNEISRERSLILSSNIERMGFRNVIVTNNQIDDFANFQNQFDKIILDAPCSGSGMFRKEEKMKDDWSYSKVLSLSQTQKELIIKAYDLLKPGGKIIYSTCSFSYEEDEEVVNHLLINTNAKLVQIDDNPMFFKSKSQIGIHLFPHLFPGEGHYICLIEKPLNNIIIPYFSKNKTDKYDDIKKICNVEGYVYQFNNIFYLLPHYFDTKNLKVVRGGLKLGTKEKYGFEFDHALSHYLKSYNNEAELDQLNIQEYLKGNTLYLKMKEGIVLIKYKNNTLGFAKSIKGRVNNKYPKGLRKNNLIF